MSAPDFELRKAPRDHGAISASEHDAVSGQDRADRLEVAVGDGAIKQRPPRTDGEFR